jgi:hypothetical protein
LSRTSVKMLWRFPKSMKIVFDLRQELRNSNCLVGCWQRDHLSTGLDRVIRHNGTTGVFVLEIAAPDFAVGGSFRRDNLKSAVWSYRCSRLRQSASTRLHRGRSLCRFKMRRGANILPLFPMEPFDNPDSGVCGTRTYEDVGLGTCLTVDSANARCGLPDLRICSVLLVKFFCL